jgi:hypothetical protein
MSVPILKPECRWECLSCDATHVTHETQPHTPFHNCRRLVGLSVPFVPAGTKGRHVVRQPDDYVGDSDVQTDGEGRVVMSLQTVRDQGEDCTVYAPCATSGGSSE